MITHMENNLNKFEDDYLRYPLMTPNNFGKYYDFMISKDNNTKLFLLYNLLFHIKDPKYMFILKRDIDGYMYEHAKESYKNKEYLTKILVHIFSCCDVKSIPIYIELVKNSIEGKSDLNNYINSLSVFNSNRKEIKDISISEYNYIKHFLSNHSDATAIEITYRHGIENFKKYSNNIKLLHFPFSLYDYDLSMDNFNDLSVMLNKVDDIKYSNYKVTEEDLSYLENFLLILNKFDISLRKINFDTISTNTHLLLLDIVELNRLYNSHFTSSDYNSTLKINECINHINEAINPEIERKM